MCSSMGVLISARGFLPAPLRNHHFISCAHAAGSAGLRQIAFVLLVQLESYDSRSFLGNAIRCCGASNPPDWNEKANGNQWSFLM